MYIILIRDMYQAPFTKRVFSEVSEIDRRYNVKANPEICMYVDSHPSAAQRIATHICIIIYIYDIKLSDIKKSLITDHHFRIYCVLGYKSSIDFQVFLPKKKGYLHAFVRNKVDTSVVRTKINYS